MTGWRDIRTASASERPVLLYATPRYGFSAPVIVVGYFITGLGWLAAAVAPQGTTSITPTHWMPLPEPPSSSEGQSS